MALRDENPEPVNFDQLDHSVAPVRYVEFEKGYCFASYSIMSKRGETVRNTTVPIVDCDASDVQRLQVFVKVDGSLSAFREYHDWPDESFFKGKLVENGGRFFRDVNIQGKRFRERGFEPAERIFIFYPFESPDTALIWFVVQIGLALLAGGVFVFVFRFVYRKLQEVEAELEMEQFHTERS